MKASTLSPAPPRAHRRSWWLAIAVIGSGVILGFLITRFEATGTEPTGDATVTTLVHRSSQAPAKYEWTETDLPDGVPLATAEFDGFLFVLVGSFDSDGSMAGSLWTSETGDTWREIVLDLAPEARITDLDTDRDSLILSGSVSGVPTLWTSLPNRRVDPESWFVTPLENNGAELGPALPHLTTTLTVINDEGEVFTSAIVFRDVSGSLPGQALDEQTLEVEVSVGRLWVRLIDDNGDPALHTLEIPAGANVIDLDHQGGDLYRIGTWSSWVSEDGAAFEFIDAESRLPLAPVAFGYRSIFLTKTSDEHNTRLWQTASGQGWVDTPWVPPDECGDWDTLANSGGRLLLMSPLLSTACVSDNGTDWEVIPTPLATTPSGPRQPALGGPSGFLMVTPNTTNWLWSSRDGVNWEPVETPSTAATPLMQFVGDRVIATGIADADGGPTWWIGTSVGSP